MSAQIQQLQRRGTQFAHDELVIQQARRITDGPDPRFGDLPTWNLAALGWPPNIGPHINSIRFGDLPISWIETVKSVAMAMLNPAHPVVRSAGVFGTAKPYKPKTVRMYVDALTILAKWAEATNRIELASWTQTDCDTYLDWVKARAAYSAQRLAVDVLQSLFRYSAVIPGQGLRFEPWNGLSGVRKLGQSNPGGEIKTEAIDPDTWWPLLRACWAYIDVFAPDILAANQRLAELRDARDVDSGRLSRLWVESALESWLESGDGFIPLHIRTYGNAKANEISWSTLSLLITEGKAETLFPGDTGMSRRRKDRVRQAIDDGFPTRLGFMNNQPASIELADGSTGPWVKGFDPGTVSIELTTLRNACYIFCAAMTMMRDSELHSMKPGCLTTFYGSPAVRSELHKHQPQGTEEFWWITEPVAKAIKVAEAISPGAQRLFGPRYSSKRRTLLGFDQHDEMKKFVRRINSRSEETGLMPIPVRHIAPHMFRRTMAIITAQQPDGEIALGITLKHTATRALANSTTSGYAAETPEWAREFDHEAQEEAAGRLIGHWSAHEAGEPVARGAGASEFVAKLDRVTRNTPRERLPAVGGQRLLRDLLRDEFSQIRLGILNHCLGDPEKAACLKGKDEAVKRNGMIPSMCSPVSCRNSVVTEEHMPLWIAEEQDLTGKLQDRRIADVHRKRLQAQLDDVNTITTQESK